MAASPDWQPALRARIETFAANMSDADMLWTSGYLAGLAAGRAQPQSKPTASPPTTLPQQPPSEVLHVWYGSQTGNARGVAERFAAAAERQGATVELASLADVTPRQIRKVRLLTLVMSTHGEGDPPEDAEALHEYLLSDSAPKLQNLRYAVFGLGDSSYEHFCKTGRDFDEALQTLGGERLLDFTTADVDYENVEVEWQTALLKKVEPQDALPGNVAARPDLQLVTPGATTTGAAPQWNRQQPFVAERLAASPLTVASAEKAVHHVALSIEDSGLQYAPGDSLGVWPENAPESVAEILELAGLDGESPVTRDNQERAAADWLRNELELTRLSKPFLEQYAGAAGSDELTTIVNDPARLRAYVAEHQVADVLRAWPTSLPGSELLGMFRRLSPRLYSIASSPLAVPEEVHLTVAAVGDVNADGLLRAGCASRYLPATETGRPRVFIESNPRFRLPDDPDTPVIMIGAGTGVAPYRSFVEHRRQQGAAGDNWLIFGNRRRRDDFLYQLEWLRHHKQGTLNKLTVAFSRDQEQKVYVQDRVREHGRELHAWLDRGAHLYVCGAADGMAPGVEQALLDVLAEHGGRSPEQAQEQLRELKRQNRYQKDVY